MTAMTIKPNALSWLWLSAFVVALDQATKYWVRATIQAGEQVPVLGHFLNWTLAYNDGAAFSFLAGHGGWQRWLFTLLAIGVSIALATWLARTPRSDWRTALPLALVIGGALGNLVDRVALGHVTDFVLVYFGDWAYPAFNVADAAISVGAVLLILFSFGHAPKSRGT